MTENAVEEVFGDQYKLAETSEYSPCVVDHVQGATIVGLSAQHPLRDSDMEYAKVPIFHGDHVTSDTGSGLVHTSPSHGVDDFDIYATHKPNGAIFDIVSADGFFVRLL